MPIPEFIEGNLPIGLHDCTVEDIQERFGHFARSDRRIVLTKALLLYLDELRVTRLAAYVIVDGSYVTEKAEPNDIDLLVVLKEGDVFDRQLRPFEYNVISKRRVRRRYPFDLFVAPEDSETYAEMVDFFQDVRNMPGQRKGLVRITL